MVSAVKPNMGQSGAVTLKLEKTPSHIIDVHACRHRDKQYSQGCANTWTRTRGPPTVQPPYNTELHLWLKLSECNYE